MRSHRVLSLFLFASLMMGASQSLAGEASVLDATARANPDGTYAITATVAHRDEGWSHYANKWDVLAPNGNLIATRTLYHPHVNEQPFTRSLARVEVPIGLSEVIIRAGDSKHGDGTRTFTLKLPPRK